MVLLSGNESNVYYENTIAHTSAVGQLFLSRDNVCHDALRKPCKVRVTQSLSMALLSCLVLLHIAQGPASSLGSGETASPLATLQPSVFQSIGSYSCYSA